MQESVRSRLLCDLSRILLHRRVEEVEAETQGSDLAPAQGCDKILCLHGEGREQDQTLSST